MTGTLRRLVARIQYQCLAIYLNVKDYFIMRFSRCLLFVIFNINRYGLKTGWPSKFFSHRTTVFMQTQYTKMYTKLFSIAVICLTLIL